MRHQEEVVALGNNESELFFLYFFCLVYVQVLGMKDIIREINGGGKKDLPRT